MQIAASRQALPLSENGFTNKAIIIQTCKRAMMAHFAWIIWFFKLNSCGLFLTAGLLKNGYLRYPVNEK